MLRALPNRQKAYYALFCLNDPALPFGQVNAEWLRKPPGDIVDQRETRLLLTRRGLVVFIVGNLFVVLAGFFRLIVGSLDRPEKECREAGVFF